MADYQNLVTSNPITDVPPATPDTEVVWFDGSDYYIRSEAGVDACISCGSSGGNLSAMINDLETVNLVANVNNLALTTQSGYRFTGGSNDISGVVAPSPAGDRMIMIVNRTPGNVKLLHDDAGSLAANRFFCPSETDYHIKKGATCLLAYVISDQRWQVLGTTH